MASNQNPGGPPDGGWPIHGQGNSQPLQGAWAAGPPLPPPQPWSTGPPQQQQQWSTGPPPQPWATGLPPQTHDPSEGSGYGGPLDQQQGVWGGNQPWSAPAPTPPHPPAASAAGQPATRAEYEWQGPPQPQQGAWGNQQWSTAPPAPSPTPQAAPAPAPAYQPQPSAWGNQQWSTAPAAPSPAALSPATPHVAPPAAPAPAYQPQQSAWQNQQWSTAEPTPPVAAPSVAAPLAQPGYLGDHQMQQNTWESSAQSRLNVWQKPPNDLGYANGQPPSEPQQLQQAPQQSSQLSVDQLTNKMATLTPQGNPGKSSLNAAAPEFVPKWTPHPGYDFTTLENAIMIIAERGYDANRIPLLREHVQLDNTEGMLKALVTFLVNKGLNAHHKENVSLTAQVLALFCDDPYFLKHALARLNTDLNNIVDEYEKVKEGDHDSIRRLINYTRFLGSFFPDVPAEHPRVQLKLMDKLYELFSKILSVPEIGGAETLYGCLKDCCGTAMVTIESAHHPAHQTPKMDALMEEIRNYVIEKWQPSLHKQEQHYLRKLLDLLELRYAKFVDIGNLKQLSQQQQQPRQQQQQPQQQQQQLLDFKASAMNSSMIKYGVFFDRDGNMYDMETYTQRGHGKGHEPTLNAWRNRCQQESQQIKSCQQEERHMESALGLNEVDANADPESNSYLSDTTENEEGEFFSAAEQAFMDQMIDDRNRNKWSK